ncbi:nuclear transport factor 2 family protein, partial [uncultured Neisseria sp.]|uniref:nuclear transport factor 2 family protein n=1 Tax=uncultured Neisseria sp. TaxID=237778 RepID=UPI0026293C6A
MNTAEYLYHAWHDAAKSRDTDALIALYYDDAELESPLVPIIMQRTNGTLRGKAEIRAFLAEGARRRPNEWVRWYRDARYYTGDGTLIWEYPRQTPDGNQVDILEVMQHRDG